MSKVKKHTLEDIKNSRISIERFESDSIVKDVHGNDIDLEEATRIADEQIESLKVNVNFRWTQKEVERAKIIAEKKGLKYQTYLKSTLKQAMDKDAKELGIAS